MNRQALRHLGQAATVASAALILFATLSPNPPDPGGMPDWVAHFGLFGLIGASAALWYATSDLARRSPQRALVGVLLALWLFGGLTELAQSMTATRDASMSDLIVDVIGAVAGFLAGSVLWRAVLGRVAR